MHADSKLEQHGEGFLEVVIASTFKNADEVINMVDNPAEWYPVKPAADYGDVEALGINEEPGRQPKAVWILLRKIPYAPENGLVRHFSEWFSSPKDTHLLGQSHWIFVDD